MSRRRRIHASDREDIPAATATSARPTAIGVPANRRNKEYQFVTYFTGVVKSVPPSPRHHPLDTTSTQQGRWKPTSLTAPKNLPGRYLHNTTRKTLYDPRPPSIARSSPPPGLLPDLVRKRRRRARPRLKRLKPQRGALTLTPRSSQNWCRDQSSYQLGGQVFNAILSPIRF